MTVTRLIWVEVPPGVEMIPDDSVETGTLDVYPLEVELLSDVKMPIADAVVCP